ncbi:hypothetical protein BHE74_00014999 [Ensete ventricosum]|nr:hypothetical protein GW17_00052629 [Ensete ventricosum]RWW76883.1 hypothetical protein BHE74_00014999 [Ensete ventricosum]RZS21716.1 hypothetical protein BHM03_00054385 [Ensete ventricosum]
MSVLLIVLVCCFWVAVGLDLGPTLREVCAANRSDEKQVIHLDVVWTPSLPLLHSYFCLCVYTVQQVKALLQNAGTSMCPDYADWFGIEESGVHSRQADRSVLTKFLQAHPTDYATTKLQVRYTDFLYYNSMLSVQFSLAARA